MLPIKPFQHLAQIQPRQHAFSFANVKHVTDIGQRKKKHASELEKASWGKCQTKGKKKKKKSHIVLNLIIAKSSNDTGHVTNSLAKHLMNNFQLFQKNGPKSNKALTRIDP